MDPLTGLATAAGNAFRTAVANSNLLEYVIGAIVVIAVLHLEVSRRNVPTRDAGHAGSGCGANTKKLLQKYAPEVMGLTACLALSTHLRMREASNGAADTVDEQTYTEISKQWPILLTADTLLSLQAMFRLLVLISTVLHSGGGATLLSQEAAALSCGAALGRALLAGLSNVYLLDGPLGGYLPVACELLSVPLLAILSRGVRRSCLVACVLALAAAAWVGSRNHLSLAGDKLIDGLFVFAHVAELIAAFAYLTRALLLDAGLSGDGQESVALWYAHMLMPVQQCFAAYYFVQAFEFVPGLVGAGHPFELLMMGGVAQLGAYSGASILHMAEYIEAPTQTPVQSPAQLPPQSLTQESAPGIDQDLDDSVATPHLAVAPQRTAALIF